MRVQNKHAQTSMRAQIRLHIQNIHLHRNMSIVLIQYHCHNFLDRHRLD